MMQCYNVEFESFLADTGLSREYVDSVSRNTDDLIDMPDGVQCSVSTSLINGLGLFADKAFHVGELIAPARLDGMRTPAGRYANHSNHPNAEFLTIEGDIILIAKRDIQAREEITVDYRQALGANAAAECFSFPSLIQSTGIQIDELSNRQKVELIEYALAKNYKNIGGDMPVTHMVCNGVYYRELFIPEGSALTGKVHRERHICILMQGDLSVLTDEGMKRIQAPYRFISEPGMKRAGYAHTDCIFTTVHSTDLTDITQIEEALFYDSDLSWIEERLLLSGDKICQQSQSESG